MQPILPPIENNLMLFVSFCLCLLSAFIISLFIIPLQIEQAGVKNGLAKLRYDMLGLCFTTLITTLIASYFLAIVSIRAIDQGTYVSTLSQIILTIFSTGKFMISIFAYRIYHRQYTPQHIEDSERNEIFHKRKSSKK